MKNILIFNDISGLGNCSLSANLPIFTHLGHYCMPIVTACYSCQTGFSDYAVTPNPSVVEFAEKITANATPNAFYVGFCNDNSTLEGVKTVVNDVLPKDCYLFVDPIMGDNGKLYPVFNARYVDYMKSVVAGADCISPNLTEACLLIGADYGKLVSHNGEADYIDFCKSVFSSFLKQTQAKSAVITGISHGGMISNLVLDGVRGIKEVATERVNVDYSGTGDVFSSVLLGLLLNGASLYDACYTAATFVAKSAEATDRTDRRFGVDFCKLLKFL